MEFGAVRIGEVALCVQQGTGDCGEAADGETAFRARMLFARHGVPRSLHWLTVPEKPLPTMPRSSPKAVGKQFGRTLGCAAYGKTTTWPCVWKPAAESPVDSSRFSTSRWIGLISSDAQTRACRCCLLPMPK